MRLYRSYLLPETRYRVQNMSERRVARHLQTRRPPRRAFLRRQRQEGADTTQSSN